MNDDLPPETRQLREDKRQISKYAEEKGYTSKVSGSKLIVDGVSYESSELELLPKDILPERVKTRRRGNGHTACFSNFYPCRFSYEGVEYTSSEQAFQHRKAVETSRDANAHAIMQMTIAKKIKLYGDKMPTSSKWEANKVNILEDIIYHKFAQLPTFRNKLCDTMDLPLYEATTNQFWSCGLKMNARQWSTGIYPGRNIMGLMRVRSRMQDSRARLNHSQGETATIATATSSFIPQRAALSGSDATGAPASAVGNSAMSSGDNTSVMKKTEHVTPRQTPFDNKNDMLTSTPTPVTSDMALSMPRVDEERLPLCENDNTNESD